MTRLALVALLLAGCAATPSVAVTREAEQFEHRPGVATIDSDEVQRFGRGSMVSFIGNVVARQDYLSQHADRIDVYLNAKGDRIVRTVSTGNVRIVAGDCRTATAAVAEYHDADQRVVLSGNVLVRQKDKFVNAEMLVINLAQARSASSPWLHCPK